jgi:cell filamentation protein
MNDPYVYPGTETLKNLFGERDEERLKEIEADYTGFRIRELMDSPAQGDYGFSHLCRLHQHIFQDIFEWAGNIRTINIEKPESVLGGLSVEYSNVTEITGRAPAEAALPWLKSGITRGSAADPRP